LKKTRLFYFFFSIILLVTLALPGCATAYPKNVLYVNIIWHQHQPLYYKDADGIYTRPWVRVHATKDYYDMAYLVSQYPNVHVTFNLTPVLIRQIDDFVNNNARDIYWVLAEKPAGQLFEDDKRFILQRFFDANWDHIIARFPRYHELLVKRNGTDEAAISAALTSFSEQDFRDLQIWFNLAWFDPMFLEQDPLQALVIKGRDFSEDDKAIVFEQVRKVMSEIIPLHKELQDKGQIQVITTPYAHPILPLIFNSDIAKVGNPDALLPNRFSWPNDAIAHLQKSVEIYTQHFGKAPTGLWPGEGSVSEDIVPLVIDAGYQWMATGEPVLAQSLGIGNFTRDANDTVQEADALYRPYYVQDNTEQKIGIFFRDGVISDKLGFEYSNMAGEEAAADLMQRLENIRVRLDEENTPGPHVVSIILDGENAWENYDNDGKEFLNAMYRLLSESKTVRTITPSEYLKAFPDQNTLDFLFPGAWFSPNYDTWIGEGEEQQAWNYLGMVREDLAQYDVLKKKETSPDALAQAQDFMYLAEGSDWFWWYGSDQDSGVDEYFDTGFRALLKSVYESLGETPPSTLSVPIIPARPAQVSQAMQGFSTPVIDGVSTPGEWDTAAVYGEAQGTSASSFAYTVDKQNIFFKLDLTNSLPAGSTVGIYIKVPNVTPLFPFVRRTEADATPLQYGISATHLFEWDGTTLNAFTATENGWAAASQTGSAAQGENSIEVQIPQSALGEIQTGDDIRFAAVILPEGQVLPSAGPAQLLLPDLGLSQLLFEVSDPLGDDNGPGSYTYPTDTVFKPGVFDIKTFGVYTDTKNLIFKLEFDGPVPNPWNSTQNLSLQTIDVYIDKDPGANTGARLLLPGRNAALSKGNGWDFAVFTEGWYPAIYSPDPATFEPKNVNVEFKIIVDANAQSVTMRVPLDVFGEGDPLTWGYVAVVLSQEGFPSTGVLRVRDVLAASEQWKLGGAPSDTNHTRIVDLAWPDGATPAQADMLGSYLSSNNPVDSLNPDDFAQIEENLAPGQ
jgi:alpha-amylase/alpha-mannosidase (GH57 family)